MSTQPQPSQVSNRYRLIQQLGAGGMGVVYEAFDRLTGQSVALKLVDPARTEPDGSQSTQQAAAHQALKLQLTHEFQTLATLRHPHIISVLDYGFDYAEPEPQIYYTMELLVGARTILDYGRDLPITRRIDLLIELLSALEYLHRRRILHRDVKPENVLVTAQGSVKVTDFGLALLRDQPYEGGQITGTLTYIPPEILQGGTPGQASDLYAVGLIAYQLFAGEYPFDTTDVNHLLRSILYGEYDIGRLYPADQVLFEAQARSAAAAEHAPTLTLIITRLLEKDPAERYQRASDVIHALYAAMGEPPPAERADIRDSFLQAAQFIGREAEWARLQAAADALLHNQGSAFLIGGESGIGKSRLLDELRIYALTRGAQVVRGQAIDGGGLPYQLWRDPLRRLALSTPLTDLEAGILKAILPDIEGLLERPIPDAPPVDANAASKRLLRTITHVLEIQTRPLVLLLEDLQWTTESLDILKSAVGLLRQHPVLIIGTFRNDERPDLPAALPDMTFIPLQRLPPDAISALSASMLGDAGQNPDLLQLIQAETEGNVFFIVEVVRTLAEQAGSLDRVGSHTLPLEVFAGGVKQILRRRIGRVPAADHALLMTAAAAGRTLDLAVIHEIAAAHHPALQLESWLLRCADAAVLEVFEGTWRFTHDKLRDVLLGDAQHQGISEQINRQIAVALEHLYPMPAERALRALVLAQHWNATGDRRREVDYLVLAGEQMINTAQYETAVETLERALDLLTQQDAPAISRARVMSWLCVAHYNRGDFESNRKLSHETLALLGFTPLDGSVHRRRAMLIAQVARQIRYRVLPRLRRTSQPERFRLAMQVTETRMMIHYFQNDRRETIYYILFGLNLADASGQNHNAVERARFYGSATFMFGITGWHGLADVYDKRWLETFDALRDLNAVAWVLQFTGIYLILRARWDAARDRLRRALEIAHQLEHARRIEETYVTLIAIEYYSGRWESARVLTDALYGIAIQAANPQTQGWAIDNYGRFALREGDYAEARRFFLHALDLYSQIDDTIGIVWLKGAIAKTHLAEGDMETAYPYIEAIQPILHGSVSTSFGMVEALGGIIDYWLMRWSQARERRDLRDAAWQAVDHLGRYSRKVQLARAQYWLYCGRFYAVAGDAERSKRLFLRAIHTAQRAGMPFEEGIACTAYAELFPPGSAARQEYAARAADLLRAIGALDDLRRAERL
ncbi:MAG: AAA family ATPase [bacterium]|nr:AAA family ATPase [bacterium]